MTGWLPSRDEVSRSVAALVHADSHQWVLDVADLTTVRHGDVHGGFEIAAQPACFGGRRQGENSAGPRVQDAGPEPLAPGWLATVQEHDTGAEVAPYALSSAGPHSLVTKPDRCQLLSGDHEVLCRRERPQLVRQATR